MGSHFPAFQVISVIRPPGLPTETANRRVSILPLIPPLSKRFLLSDLPAEKADRRIWRMMAIVRRFVFCRIPSFL